jgi:hypothetical protein
MENLGLGHLQGDVKQIMKALLVALFLGLLFLFFSIHVPEGKLPAPTRVGAAMGEALGIAAAKAAGLLWAFAWCVVGSFIGFLFGIPRTLSSDTARTTVTTSHASLEAARAQAARSVQAAKIAAEERAEASDAAQKAAKALADAESDQTHRELVDAQKTKRAADIKLSEKTSAAKAAAEEEARDREALAVLGQVPDAHPPKPKTGPGPSTAVNTNLEQISDWLTKIIVGVSLVNSEQVGRTILMAAREMSYAIGGGPVGVSVALAILVYFGVLGLLGGYLLTRLFLQPAFNAMGSVDQ